MDKKTEMIWVAVIEECRRSLNSDPGNCMTSAREILGQATSTGNRELEIQALYTLGECEFLQEDYTACLEWLNKVIDNEEKWKDDPLFEKTLRLAGQSYWETGSIDLTLDIYTRIVAIQGEDTDTVLRARDLTNIGVLKMRQGNYRDSIVSSEKAIRLFQELKDDNGMGFSLGNLGNCHFKLGQYDKALEYQRLAEDIARKTGALSFLGRTMNSISAILLKLGRFEEALEAGQQAMKVKEQINENIDGCLTNLGIICKNWNNTERALEYFHMALEAFRDRGDRSNMAMLYNNIGNLCLDAEDYENALSHFNQALSLWRELHDKAGTMSALSNIGITCMQLPESSDKAESCLAEALRLARELGKMDMIASTLASLVEIDIARGNLALAQDKYRECRELLDCSDAYELKLELYQTGVDLYRALGEYSSALDLYGEYVTLKDQVFTKENQRQISEMQTRFETERKEKEAEIYRLKSIELAEKNRQIQAQKDALEKTLEDLEKSEIKYNLVAEELKKTISIDLVGEHNSIRKITELISIVAKSDTTNVLIVGESGTGKEIVARKIHQCSNRKAKSFYGVNSAAVPDSLFESQFFGHEKNAFTGAEKTHIGWFEVADGGTLFLDEISSMSVEQQVKLLRALEERRIIRVGSHHEIPFNVRIISATNVNLFEMVRQKQFREDLYHRLAAFVIHIPPLRMRKEDIPLLLEYFVKKFSVLLGKRIRKIDKTIVPALLQYDFPGNVRELKNIIERALIVADSSALKRSHFLIPDTDTGIANVQTLDELERLHITRALQLTGFNQSKAAELLGVERRVVARKMSRLGINRQSLADS